MMCKYVKIFMMFKTEKDDKIIPLLGPLSFRYYSTIGTG